MTILVTIPSYEELEDHNGQMFTVYTVTIDDLISGLKWYVLKRYSEFQSMFLELKDKYSELHTFNFPHKSMFNTFSQFTKERRRQGFEDFLKLAISLKPYPFEIDDFLDVEHHRKKLTPNNKASLTKSFGTEIPSPLTPSKTITENTNNTTLRDRNNTRNLSLRPRTNNPKIITIPSKSQRHGEKNNGGEILSDDILFSGREEVAASARVRAELPGIVVTTFVTTMLVYFVCVSFSIIDISSTTLGRILLTLVSLGSTFTIIRVILIQRESEIKSILEQAEYKNNKKL